MSATKPADQDVLRTAAEAATWAPSVHNSQPWRFEIHDESLDVFADDTRWLHAIDPTGREMHISCGAAIFFARLALRGLSRRLEVSLLPDTANPAHLARLTVVAVEDPTTEETDLIRAIPVRYTDRGRFDDEALPVDLVTALMAGVGDYGAWLRPVTSEDDAIATAVLLAHADDTEQVDPAYVAELQRWSRYDAGATDGIPRQAVSDVPVGERASMYRLRDFDVDGRARSGTTGRVDSPPAAEHPFVCILGTPGDDTRSWLEAGMALGWLLLRATSAGVVAQPMTQPVEVPAARIRLSQALGLVGHPQMVLRMGHGSGQPTTHRRAPGTVIDLD
jgi:hypothetical protein